MTDRCKLCGQPIAYRARMTATCSICGKVWDMRDPGVRYIHGDGAWECTEEGPCFDRAAMNQLHEEVQA